MSRRSYRSARRRRWGRYDPAPVLLVTEDDRTLYLGSAVRMVWRYRSELAPFTTALALLACAAWTHARNPGTAVPLAALTVVLTAVLGLPPHRWPGTAGRRLVAWLNRWPVYAHRAERLYAAALLALGGAWWTVATAQGPGAGPLPTLLLLGTLAGGIPWWTHHRRRARVRVTRTVEAWPTFAEAAGLPGSRLLSAVVDRWGWSGRLALRRGQTVAQAIAAAPGIESALAVRPGAVRVEPDPVRADRAVLRVIESDPLATAAPWPGLPGADTTEAGRAPSVVDPVELGVFEDGSPILLRVAYRNALLGGMIGSGKSGVLNVLLAFLVACRDTAVWGIDLKGGMELRPWTSCLGRLATTGPDAVELLREAMAVRNQRMQTLGGRLWDPAVHGPALIVVIDEFAELSDEGKALAESLARIGRAVMVNLVIATQRPTQEALGGGALRSQCEIRICLRMKEKRDVDLVLDRGAWAAGWRADLLDLPGKLLLSDPEHTIPRPGRAYLINDQKITETAAAYTGWQPTIPAHDSHSDADPDNASRPTGRHAAAEHHDHDARTDNRAEADGRTGITDAVLWTYLREVPDEEGVTVADIIENTGLSRATVYRRLRALAEDGQAVQLGDGYWRAM